jgi:hypothetical protein
MVVMRGGHGAPRGRNAAPLSLAAPEPADVVTGGLRSQPAALPRPSAGARLPAPAGLPIPALPVLPDSARGAGARCVVTPVDRDGRLADRSVVTFLGWSAGQAVEWAFEPGPIVVARAAGGVRISPRGFLRLPLAARRACRIAAEDRVLVVADQRRSELLVIPMAALEDMVAACRQSPGSGARR